MKFQLYLLKIYQYKVGKFPCLWWDCLSSLVSYRNSFWNGVYFSLMERMNKVMFT